jgi:hypothetical protein
MVELAAEGAPARAPALPAGAAFPGGPSLGGLSSDGWRVVPYPDDWRDLAGAASGTVHYGPELRTLREIRLDADGAWGKLVAPAPHELGGARRGRAWRTPAALIDGILFICDLWAQATLGTRQLPLSIGRLELSNMPPAGERCLARLLHRGRNGREMLFDFALFGADGRTILSVFDCCVVDLGFSLQDAVGGRRPGG